MSLLLDLQDQIQNTEEAIARLERAATVEKSPSILSMSRSLEKRRTSLEHEFLEAAKDLGVEVCSYRLFDSNGQPKIAGVSRSLGGFQQMFSVTFDAIQSGKQKERTRISAEVEQTSAFEFAYAFSGSIGIVLTVPSEILMFPGSKFDETIATIREMSSAVTPRQVL